MIYFYRPSLTRDTRYKRAAPPELAEATVLLLLWDYVSPPPCQQSVHTASLYRRLGITTSLLAQLLLITARRQLNLAAEVPVLLIFLGETHSEA